MSKVLILILIIIGALILISGLIIAIVFAVKKKKNQTQEKLQNEFADNLISALGGIDNINQADLSRRRLNILINDLNLLKPKELRNLKVGASITKNNVKLLVKDNPKKIYKYINNKRKEGK